MASLIRDLSSEVSLDAEVEYCTRDWIRCPEWIARVPYGGEESTYSLLVAVFSSPPYYELLLSIQDIHTQKMTPENHALNINWST